MRHSYVRTLVAGVFLLSGSALFAQAPVVQSVLSAADYSPQVAPGVWVAIFGTNLASAAVTNTTLPIPTQLGGVTVSIRPRTNVTGTPIPLRYVSQGQINALIPPESAAGYYQFIVSTPAGDSDPYLVGVSTVAPAIYTKNATGTGPALAFDGNFQPVTQVSSSPIVIYASGLGPTNPPGTSAGGNSTEPFNRVTIPPFVQIGGATAQVLFAGLAPGLPGVYQLNIAPTGALSDNTFRVNGSAVTTLPIPVGLNTAGVTGNITPVYPVKTTVLPYSPMIQATNISAAFDILPGASPFKLAAACGTASMFVTFDPAHGTWQATTNVPPATERQGDFNGWVNAQGTLLQIRDFLNNNLPFPGNAIPASRLDPAATQAVSAIPLPNSGTANANYVAQGTIPATGHFVIDASNNSNLANFGDYYNALNPGTNNQFWRTNVCSLTIDGVLVSSNETSFQ